MAKILPTVAGCLSILPWDYLPTLSPLPIMGSELGNQKIMDAYTILLFGLSSIFKNRR